MIIKAVTGSAHFPQNVNTSGHGDCEPDLRVIVRSLAEIHNETAPIKTGGRMTDEVQELKDNFEQEVEQLAKERDVFELDFKREVLKREGEMYERIHVLKKSIQDLKQRIREAEEEFYELAFELVGIRVETNSMDGKEQCYAGMIPKGRFGGFFEHIVANHGYGTLLEAMYLLQQIYDPKDIFYEFMEEFQESPPSAQVENHKMVLTFICWATKQDNRILQTFSGGCYLYHLYNMTTQFFPTSNDGLQAVRLAEPVLKRIPGTCNDHAISFYLKEFTVQKNKEKHENLKRAGKCDQLQ
ncbi:34 kDa salivary secreted protein 34k-2 [Culex quinquefasciatus]|nr:34 kDa salivary secreted protein 34k-2 [Culex quinquefasciatus]|eukprot:XP_001866234.1 34 kDa salivary secreted protein 34k-2 [Culex quinquefasciatus]